MFLDASKNGKPVGAPEKDFGKVQECCKWYDDMLNDVIEILK